MFTTPISLCHPCTSLEATLTSHGHAVPITPPSNRQGHFQNVLGSNVRDQTLPSVLGPLKAWKLLGGEELQCTAPSKALTTLVRMAFLAECDTRDPGKHPPPFLAFP